MTDESVFAQALAIGSPTGRAAYLDRACAGNPALRAEVEALLAAHGASNPLDRPPGDVAATGGYAPERPADPDEAVGAVLAGKYKLVEPIGQGGMGAVYMAQQTDPVKRLVAVKVIRDGMDSRNVLARFEAERQALALMDHPNIAKVLDAGTTEAGRPFFVMELVKGVPVTEFCDARKLSPRERLELFVPVCQAIQHAHQKGIIHRDIKPTNVLVALYDGRPVPKVIDFGVAKAAGQPLTDLTLVTGFGAIVGTPEYMSPEQAELNQLDIDTRSDVFALGVLLYELLTGSTPLDRARLDKAALLEVLRLVREEDPPKPSTRVSTSGTVASIAAARGTDPVKLSKLMKGELDWIVMKALEKDRARRYESATALARDVERHLAGDAVEACPPTLGYRLKKAYRKNRAAVRVVCGFLGVILGAAGAAAGLAVRATQAERAAVAARDAEADQRAEALRQRDGAEAERDKANRANVELARATDVQRRTRYAAEMNLLQAAHLSKDLGRVKQLLFAQVPKPGEPDLRGPEWHYWHRKFYGHDSEFRIPWPQPRGDTPLSPPALAPDGGTLAIPLPGKTDGRTVQLWSVAGGKKLRDIELAPDTGGPRRLMGVCYFSTDSERLFVTDSKQSNDPKEGPALTDRREWIVTVRDGTVRDLRPLVRTGFARVSPDLRTLHETHIDEEKGAAVHTFRDIADGKELGRLRTEALDAPTLCPNRTHVLTVTSEPLFGPGQKPVKPGTRKPGTYAYWKLGEDKPVWEWIDALHPTIPDDVSINETTFRRLVNSQGMLYWMTNSLTTGQPVSRQLLGTTTDFPLFSRASSCVSNREGTRLACGTTTGFVVFDSRDSSKAATSRDTALAGFDVEFCEHYYGPFAFTAEGGIVSANQVQGQVLVPGRGFDSEVIVRKWSLPPVGHLHGRAPWPAGETRDQSRFAFVTGVPVPGDPKAYDERLVVLDAAGALVFSADIPDSRSTSVRPASRRTCLFSDDGRYLVYSDNATNDGFFLGMPEKTRSGPVLVWDLQTKREVARIAPELETRYYFASQIDMSPIDPTGTRLLLGRSKPTQAVGGISSFSVEPPRVFEFPSGKPLFDLKVPKGENVNAAMFQGEDVLGFSWRPRPTDVDKNSVCHVWSARTGEYCGTREVDRPRRAPSVANQWAERGGRATRYVPGKDAGTGTVEVWDAARRGPTDRPVCTIEAGRSSNLKLNPDGSRLLISFWDSRLPTALYCTTTGRELVSFPIESHQSGRRQLFGAWSPDGNEFWYGVNPDGKPYGHNFRPVPEPKK